jgi:hypothetical protein
MLVIHAKYTREELALGNTHQGGMHRSKEAISRYVLALCSSESGKLICGVVELRSGSRRITSNSPNKRAANRYFSTPKATSCRRGFNSRWHTHLPPLAQPLRAGPLASSSKAEMWKVARQESGNARLAKIDLRGPDVQSSGRHGRTMDRKVARKEKVLGLWTRTGRKKDTPMPLLWKHGKLWWMESKAFDGR